MFQPKKQPAYLLDRTMIRAKLDTFLTLYGMDEVSEILNEWSNEQSAADWGVWEMGQVLKPNDVGALVGKEQ